MAGASDAMVESEGDYESDSDGTSTLALRRRAASDDEEDETRHERARVEGDGAGAHLTQYAASSLDGESSRLPYSDDEADDGEGAPPLYEEDEEEEEEEEEFLLEEEGSNQRDAPSRQLLSRRRRKGSDEEEEDEEVARGRDGQEGSAGGSKRGESPELAEGGADSGVAKESGKEERKEAEPFVVPTAGAFYMHDDRFRDNGGARPRRSMGGRKLWEAKDEKPWVHDLFEELNRGLENFSVEGFQGGGRGRSRGRGRGRAHGRGGDVRVSNSNDNIGGMRSWPISRGRVSRGEFAESAREEAPGAANYAAKISNKSAANTGTDQDHPTWHQDSTVVKKAATSSYLNSASPPFIPSGALQQKLAGRVDAPGETERSPGLSQSKGREQYGPGEGNFSAQMTTETVIVPKSASGSGRGSVGGFQNAGHLWSGNGVITPTSPQQLSKPAFSSGSQQPKLEGKLQNSQNVNRPLVTPANQSGRGTASQNQAAGFVSTPQPQRQAQPPQQSHPTNTNPRLSPQAYSGSVGNSSVLGSNNTRYKSNGGGRGAHVVSMPVAGRGSYMFPGAPNSGLRVGDAGFQPAPTVGPVQYGVQSPAGIGVPAVGMPMPNYPYGFPNSELTWVPVLAGGGALGAGYGAPYIAMEGAPSHMYYNSATSQPGPGYHLPGREINGPKQQPPGGLWKPPPSPELATDEFGQRQSKPRRYSEMNFGQ